MSFNIAIDGPAGAGKSTIAKKAAERLSFIYVDTGALYRAIAFYMWRKDVDVDNEPAVEAACENIDITIQYECGKQQVILNGENVNEFIRNELIGEMASKTSAYSSVRRKLLELQKEIAMKNNVVMDGRDIGTCVLPNADLKVYLTADSSVRAERRYLELKEKGIEGDKKEIEEDIRLRDQRDTSRKISPLKRAEDAIEINTSHMTIQEVVQVLVELANDRKEGAC